MPQALFIQLSRLGDCLQSTPLLASWRRRHPHDRVTVLIRPEYAPIFAGSPDVDEVLPYAPPSAALADEGIGPVDRLNQLHAWVESLKQRQYQIVINLTHDPLSSWLAAALAPAENLGLAVDHSGEMRTRDPWGLYTLSLLKYRSTNVLNIADCYAHLSGGASVRDSLLFRLDPQNTRTAEDWLGGRSAGYRCTIGFQPGANKVERRWPVDDFVELGRRLAADGVRVLVFGNKEEDELGRRIAEAVPAALSFAGRTSIPQLAALLAQCCILVTNDTGTMHLASAVGTRVVALFESSAYFRETGPYGPGHWIVQSADVLDYGERTADELSRIRRIPVDEVYWAVDSLLVELGNIDTARAPEIARPLASHFRSTWEDGHLDFYPARPAPLAPDILCGQLQKPVWLASLDSADVDARDAAARTLGRLRQHYRESPERGIQEMATELQHEVQRIFPDLSRMKKIILSAVEKLRRNPNHIIPQDRVSELNELERRILQLQSQPALQSFVSYFEIGLAMVEGNKTLQYLQSYLQPVLLLEKQLRLFDRILDSARNQDGV